MPHGPVPSEIDRSSPPITELLPSVIRRSTVRKRCQKGVNTRENAWKCHAMSVYHDACAHPQLVGLGRRFGSYSFLLPEIFKHVHNLFTHALCSSSPAGLRLEISCESDKKKMNFIFNFGKKIFLTEKMKHACRRESKKQCVEKSREPVATIRNCGNEQTWLLIGCASRVDRIRLCAHFLASASGA